MTVPVANGIPVRPTVPMVYGDDKRELIVHRVTEDSAGEVVTVAGLRVVKAGDVLVQTGRAGVWDVYSDKEFEDIGADDLSSVPDVGENFIEDDEEEGFDPSTHSAEEVRAYLRSDVSVDAKNAVREAEHLGLNRKSALA